MTPLETVLAAARRAPVLICTSGSGYLASLRRGKALVRVRLTEADFRSAALEGHMRVNSGARGSAGDGKSSWSLTRSPERSSGAATGSAIWPGKPGCPLLWLASRTDSHGGPMISAQALRAGLELQRRFERAGGAGRLTQGRFNDRVDGARPDPGDGIIRRLDARCAVQAALGAVRPTSRRIVELVCLFGYGLVSAEATCGLPRRTGRRSLSVGLEDLAAHYGFSASEAS